MTINAVKGTRDFYPEDMAVRTWLYNKIRLVSESFGYQEYEAPFIEKIGLYAAKSGEELVKEQAFVFQDRGGEEITLRPELTPSLARMVAQKQKSLVFPLHWWSFGPFWRYERPQRGRTREFFQWNIDIIGSNSPEADAELVSVCAAFFKEVGLSPKQVKILVNNRRLIEQKLVEIGITKELINDIFQLIDRRDRMPYEEWKMYAQDNGLSKKQITELIDLMAKKDMWKESEEMQRFNTAILATGADAYVCYEPSVVRGLDYYTGIVFEARDEDGGRAILGGGRYDNLVQDVGGEPLPGVGYAMGDVMVSIVLNKYNLIPNLGISPAEIIIAVFDQERLPKAIQLGMELRKGGLRALVYPEATKLQRQFKYADRMGIRFVAIEGPDEEAKNVVAVKDLSSGSQVEVDCGSAVEEIKGFLASSSPL